MPPPHGAMGRSPLTQEERENRPKVTKALLLRVLSWLRPYWRQILLSLACIGLSAVLGLLPSVLTGRIIDEGLLGRNLRLLSVLIALSLGVTLFSRLLSVGESYLQKWIAQHIMVDMRNQMFRHLQQMSQRFFTSSNQGEIISRMTGDISGVEQVISSTFTSILSNIVTLLAALVMMYRANWVLATVGVLIVPLFVLPTRMAGQARWTLTREAQACNDEINGILNETLSVSGQLLVKLFCREEYEYGRYAQANARMADLNIRESMAGRWFFMILSTFSSVGPMLLYFVGGILMIRYDSDLTVGDISVLVSLLGSIYRPVNALLDIQVEWIRSMALFTRLFAYFDMPIEIQNDPDANIPRSGGGRVEFRHVAFAYDPEKPVLKDISFQVPVGHSVAIVGPSGSGKSTIVNLIPRLYDVTGGSVRFDGLDVRRIDLSYLRSHIGVVSQETYLFNGSIRDNLLYAKPDATDAELMDVCEKANIADFIRRQEKGLDTQVGNRGLKLSGGEKQRLSIARVLLKDPELLIFDEATASLDSLSESRIQEAIDPIIHTRTSILIAHRLSTILSADEILVVKDGCIVERGRHAELVRAGGVYTALYETQFQQALDAASAASEEIEI